MKVPIFPIHLQPFFQRVTKIGGGGTAAKDFHADPIFTHSPRGVRNAVSPSWCPFEFWGMLERSDTCTLFRCMIRVGTAPVHVRTPEAPPQPSCALLRSPKLAVLAYNISHLEEGFSGIICSAVTLDRPLRN